MNRKISSGLPCLLDGSFLTDIQDLLLHIKLNESMLSLCQIWNRVNLLSMAEVELLQGTEPVTDTFFNPLDPQNALDPATTIMPADNDVPCPESCYGVVDRRRCIY